MRPLIGLSTGYDLEESTYVLREYYVESIIKAGGLPLILPAVQQQDIIQSYSSICDALVLTGGGDADPALWGEWPHKDLGQVNPIRDYFELQLTCNMLKMGKAIWVYAGAVKSLIWRREEVWCRIWKAALCMSKKLPGIMPSIPCL